MIKKYGEVKKRLVKVNAPNFVSYGEQYSLAMKWITDNIEVLAINIIPVNNSYYSLYEVFYREFEYVKDVPCKEKHYELPQRKITVLNSLSEESDDLLVNEMSFIDNNTEVIGIHVISRPDKDCYNGVVYEVMYRKFNYI